MLRFQLLCKSNPGKVTSPPRPICNVLWFNGQPRVHGLLHARSKPVHRHYSEFSSPLSVMWCNTSILRTLLELRVVMTIGGQVICSAV
jgi:hypothetical protein